MTLSVNTIYINTAFSGCFQIFENERFTKWARYELARMDSIKLMPAEHSIERLEADYGVMRAMIYGKYPKFNDVLKRLQELEETIHLTTYNHSY